MADSLGFEEGIGLSECARKLDRGEECKDRSHRPQHNERLDRAEDAHLARARVLGRCSVADQSGDGEQEHAGDDAVVDCAAECDVDRDGFGEDRVGRREQGAQNEHGDRGQREPADQWQRSRCNAGPRLGRIEQDERGIEHAAEAGDVGQQRVRREPRRVRASKHGQEAERTECGECVERNQPGACSNEEPDRRANGNGGHRDRERRTLQRRRSPQHECNPGDGQERRDIRDLGSHGDVRSQRGGDHEQQAGPRQGVFRRRMPAGIARHRWRRFPRRIVCPAGLTRRRRRWRGCGGSHSGIVRLFLPVVSGDCSSPGRGSAVDSVRYDRKSSPSKSPFARHSAM